MYNIKVNHISVFHHPVKNGLACLACGPQLEVVNSSTGERLSAYRFSGVNEQPPVILAVKEFTWQKRTGLLIGLEEAEGSVLCLYDLSISRIVKAVVLPGRVCTVECIWTFCSKLSSYWLHECSYFENSLNSTL